MKEPFDAITDYDKEFMIRYIRSYANVAVTETGLEKTLGYWNKSKRTLFKAFGKQLRVSIPNVEVERNTVQFQSSLNKIYYPLAVYSEYDYSLDIKEYRQDSLYFEKCTGNKFIGSVFGCLVEKCPNDFNTFYEFNRLISHYNIEKGKTIRAYDFPVLNLKIAAGMKIAKAVQKFIKAIGYPHFDLYEEWRNAISNLNANRTFKANLVLSIHPIDYMTMSDNNCDWSSCMSWTAEGAYSMGTIEMMNSNMAIVAYIESDTPFTACDMEAPNKSWRTLVFAHKDIVVVGKNYPYYNASLNQVVLEEVVKLVEKNLNWHYTFKNQNYKDTILFRSNDFVRTELSRRKMRYDKKGQARHKIILYTEAMYNDILEDPGDGYICCRNKPKRTLFLNLSGPATCLCCGERIYDSFTRFHDTDCRTKICDECRHYHRCGHCDMVLQEDTSFYYLPLIDWGRRVQSRICSHCISNYKFIPSRGIFISYGQMTDKVHFHYHNNVYSFPRAFVNSYSYKVTYVWDGIYNEDAVENYLQGNHMTIDTLRQDFMTMVPAEDIEGGLDAYRGTVCTRIYS